MSDTDISAPPPPKQRRWVLWISLFLNVVLLTLVVAGTLRAVQNRMPASLGPLLSPQIVAELPKGAREKLAAERERLRAELRAESDVLRKARRETFEAMTAVPYDAARLARSIAALNAAQAALEVRRSEIALAMIGVLTDSERQALARALTEAALKRTRERPREDRPR